MKFKCYVPVRKNICHSISMNDESGILCNTLITFVSRITIVFYSTLLKAISQLQSDRG